MGFRQKYNDFCIVHASKVFSICDRQPLESSEGKEKVCHPVLLAPLNSASLKNLSLVSRES